MNDQDRQFREWFHKEHGAIDPKDSMARSMHRHAKAWAHSAWIEARSRALYPAADDLCQICGAPMPCHCNDMEGLG